MPAKIDSAGKWALRCVNGCKSTMLTAKGFYALIACKHEDGGSLDSSDVMPTEVCICSECGYTELYAGLVTRPGVWAKK
jgi:hypothetical protein